MTGIATAASLPRFKPMPRTRRREAFDDPDWIFAN
jgi:hypothetical protein